MLIYEIITEATNVNVKIIDEIITQIIKNLPESIKESDIDNPVKVLGKDLNLDKLKNSYPKFTDFFEHLTETEFLFLNTMNLETVNVLGSYNAKNNIVKINISGILGYDYHPSKEFFEKTTNSVYAVLFHEIRHIMQHRDYPDFFTNDKARKKPYNKRDIEIDASWYHIVSSVNIKHFTAARFANHVMNLLQRNRELTSKQKQHYYKKTLAFYINPDVDPEKLNLKQHLLQNVVPKKVMKYILPHNEYDLRKLPGYNSENFLFPVARVKPSLSKILSRSLSSDIPVLMKNMLYFIPSLYMPVSLSRVWQSYVNSVHNYSLQDAISNINAGIPDNYYDFSAIKSHLSTFYN
jgi:hypothetical protein